VATLQDGSVDPKTGDVTHSVSLLEDPPSALTGFESTTDVPTKPTGAVSLFIDSIWHYEVCNVTVYNGMTTWMRIDPYDTSYTGDQDSPPQDTVNAGEWADTYSLSASTLDSSCSAKVEYGWDNEIGGTDVESWFFYIVDNPTTGSNSWSVDCPSCVAYTVNERSDWVVTNNIYVCDEGVTQEDCIARAG